MRIFLAVLGSGAFASFVTYLFTKPKQESETELNDVSKAQITLDMALKLAEEVKDFYQIRIGMLETEVTLLRQEASLLRQTVTELQKELMDLRKTI